MSRKLCFALLAVIVTLALFGTAFAADYECTLVGDEATLDTPERIEDNLFDDESYFGYSYLGKYRLPNTVLYLHTPGQDYEEGTVIPDTDYTLSWDIVSDFEGIRLKDKTSDASGDILVITGYFPDSADAYTCTFFITATVSGVSNERYRQYAIGTMASFDIDDIEVKPDEENIALSADEFAKHVIYNSKDITLGEATEDYLVTVTTSSDYNDIMNYYSRYIRSDDSYAVNLPEWLTYEVTGIQTSFPNEDLRNEFAGDPAITSIVIKFNDKYDGKLLGTLKEGTKARVNIPLLSADLTDGFGDVGFLISWDVEYHKKPDPFVITSSKTLTLNLEPGKTGSLTAEFSGSDPVKCDSKDVPAVKFIVGNTAIDPTTGKGTINITAEARDTAEDGEYESVFTFTDAAGNSDAITVKVTVKKPVTPAKTLTLTGEPKTFSLKAGGTAKTTLTAGGDVNGRITWTVGNVTPTADILVSYTATSDLSAEFSIVVGNNVAAGTYSSEIRATDSAGTSAGATLRITITADQKEQEQTDNNNTDNTNQQTDNNQTDNTNNQNQNQDTNNQNQNTDSNNQTNTDSHNLTDKIKIRGESGSSAQSKPLSSLQAGSRAVYVISLEGTGVTAKAWKLLINGLTVDSAMNWAGGFTASASTSWAAITSSDATSATIEATPPKDLNIDSAVSVAVTGTDNQEYTADLGTVSKASTSQEEQTTTRRISSSGGGCSGGFGMIVLAAMLAFKGRKHS